MKDFKKLEAYLAGELSGDDKKAFEAEMEKDVDLKRELAMREDVLKVMKPSSKDAFRTALNAVEADYKQESAGGSATPKWIWSFLLLLGLVAAFWFFNQEKSELSPSDTIPTENQSNPASEPADNQSTTIIPENPQKEVLEEPNLSPSTPTLSKPGSELIPQAPSPQKSMPIAANYEPNPLIESHLGSFTRGDFEFNIEAPTADAIMNLQNGEINFSLKGTLETEDIPEEDFALALEIYSNKAGDFKGRIVLLDEAIVLENDSSPYSFQISKAIEAEPRLYYYLIRNIFDGAIVYGSSLKVQN